MAYESVYARIWDAVVFGGGYAGFSAAWELHRSGKKVLLVDRRAALLAESGWAFSAETGSSDEISWRKFLEKLQQRTGLRANLIDGAIAEVVASEFMVGEGISVLYYAAPLAVEQSGELLAAVILGAKSGLHRLAAKQWIDTTDEGELAALLDKSWRKPAPISHTLQIFFRDDGTEEALAREIEVPGELPAETRLSWSRGVWSNENILKVSLPGSYEKPRHAWLPALKALHAAVDLKDSVVTHGSVIPFTLYQETSAEIFLPGNVASACGVGSSLAARFVSGLSAVRKLKGGPESLAPLSRNPCLLPADMPSLASEIAVAGLGTGGAVAALAAARHGAQVLAFDSHSFAGGIGSGGGVHVYYFGIKGGLQEEIDRRVRAAMPLFGTTAQVGGFHPEAKKIILEEMLAEAGVNIFYDTTIVSVSTREGLVEEAVLRTSAGPVRLRARGWIDATGDADLAAMAGASYRLGRKGDGLLQAYSQSSGRARLVEGKVKMQIVNFDAGYCDPTDEEDLTRARLAGMLHYVQQKYSAAERPTYLAPAIGLRQSRHVETEYTLTLNDLITRKRFADAIGYTGGHYDNHAKDYEFESDESAFWVWVCQQWHGRLASEIPLRVLLPQGLRNVILSCRALGVSEEAHHSVRMQRDIQRVGEAAGIAAALAVKMGADFQAVPLEELQGALRQSGALRLEDIPDSSFGIYATPDDFLPEAGQIEKWAREAKSEISSEALWHLYRAREAAREEVICLLRSDDESQSWRGAAILAMWGDNLAEKRLCQAIAAREENKAREITQPKQEWFYVPRWQAALTLLKRCLSPSCLPVLENVSTEEALPLNIRNAVALACESLADRIPSRSALRERISRILERLVENASADAMRSLKSSTPGDVLPPVEEDSLWQLHYAVARARVAWGLPLQEQVHAFLDDRRSIVRRRMKDLFSAPRPGAQADN